MHMQGRGRCWTEGAHMQCAATGAANEGRQAWCLPVIASHQQHPACERPDACTCMAGARRGAGTLAEHVHTQVHIQGYRMAVLTKQVQSKPVVSEQVFVTYLLMHKHRKHFAR